MLCDLPGVLSFLGLPPETEMPPGNKGKDEAQEALQEGGAEQGIPLRRARQGFDLAPRHGRDQGIGARPRIGMQFNTSSGLFSSRLGTHGRTKTICVW